MAKVILREDVAGLGKIGEVKQVKDGFARNYLLPKNLVFVATDNNLKKIQAEQKKKEAQKTAEKKKAQELAEKLANLSVTMAVEVNENEELYGSLTAQDIAKAILAEGFDIDKKSIVLEVPIKALGIYDIDVKLHPEVIIKVKVWVVKK